MSFYAGLAVNTLFEQLSGELLQARYENAQFPAIKEACRLILRDEARHIQFGRVIMRLFFADIAQDDKVALGEKFAAKLRGSLLNGVYSVVNLPAEERKRSAKQRALAADWGIGATHPDEEVEIIIGAVRRIRGEVAEHGVPIPTIQEIEEPREAAE